MVVVLGILGVNCLHRRPYSIWDHATSTTFQITFCQWISCIHSTELSSPELATTTSLISKMFYVITFLFTSLRRRIKAMQRIQRLHDLLSYKTFKQSPSLFNVKQPILKQDKDVWKDGFFFAILISLCISGKFL